MILIDLWLTVHIQSHENNVLFGRPVSQIWKLVLNFRMYFVSLFFKRRFSFKNNAMQQWSMQVFIHIFKLLNMYFLYIFFLHIFNFIFAFEIGLTLFSITKKLCCAIKNQSKLKKKYILYFVIHFLLICGFYFFKFKKYFFRKIKNTKIETNFENWLGYLKIQSFSYYMKLILILNKFYS